MAFWNLKSFGKRVVRTGERTRGQKEGIEKDELLLSRTVIAEVELLDLLDDVVGLRVCCSSVAEEEGSQARRSSQYRTRYEGSRVEEGEMNALLPNVISDEANDGEQDEAEVED